MRQKFAEFGNVANVDVVYLGGGNSTWTGGYFAYIELENVTEQ